MVIEMGLVKALVNITDRSLTPHQSSLNVNVLDGTERNEIN